MWLFLPFGFFSVVAVHQNGTATDHLFVRARDPRDIADMAERLRATSRKLGGTICLRGDRCHGQAPEEHVPSCPAYVQREILVTPTRDYHYRAMIHRSLWALAMGEFACDELRYPNFKAEVYRWQGIERERLYTRMWVLLRQFFSRPRA